eukprot:12027766-Karenia_brevis.AAC.1
MMAFWNPLGNTLGNHRAPVDPKCNEPPGAHRTFPGQLHLEADDDDHDDDDDDDDGDDHDNDDDEGDGDADADGD